MRRLIVMLLTLVSLLAVALPAAAATATPIVLDGQNTAVSMDSETGLVTLDQFAKAVGAEYKWVAGRQEATVVLGHRSMVLWAASPKAVVNGGVRTLAAAPGLSGNTLLVPAKVVAEALGLYVAGEKDGALVLYTGMGLIRSTKPLNFAADQILSTRTRMSMSMTSVAEPEASESFSMSLGQTLHTYQGDLLLKMDMAMPGEESGTIEMAYVDGKSYMREPGKNWMATGEPEPDMMLEILSAQFAEQWDASLSSENPALDGAVVTVTGTSEMDGVTVVNVMVSMTESNMMPQITTAMGLDAADAGDVGIRKYVQTYAIDPVTGMMHEAHTEFQMAGVDDAGFAGDLRMEINVRVNPVSLPLELPADFPR
ncbi:MAG: Copper amine oxidase N-terminal domain [Symbiobacteriaceae bacterium]|jgi:hypothetical protein|nr:Copper amine oxidase N-terminal domain [Symbiobacteriaceae bacterium]